jgi:hypothetical protein
MPTADPGQFEPQWQSHALNIAWDTPGLYTTGVVIYIPSVGDVVSPSGWITVSTAFNGTTPFLHLMSQGFGSVAEQLGYPIALSAADTVAAHTTKNSLNPLNDSVVCTDTTPLMVMVDDGAGGVPGCTVGVARIVLLTVGLALTLREPVA